MEYRGVNGIGGMRSTWTRFQAQRQGIRPVGRSVRDQIDGRVYGSAEEAFLFASRSHRVE